MKNKSILILFYFILNTVLAQKSKKIFIEYSVKKDLIETTEFLISDTKNSLYTTSFIDYDNKTNILNETKDNNINIDQRNIKINKMKYFTSSQSNLLYFVSISPKKDKTIIALDSLPNINWKIITKDSKKINNFQCYKATTVFRGSKITAYYTPEIPINSGPFKFKGLPGIILEIYNTDTNGSKYYWKVKKIVYPFESKINVIFDQKHYKEKLTSYKDLVQKFDKKMALVLKKMSTKASRGSGTVLLKKERLGIEKKYEWEEK